MGYSAPIKDIRFALEACADLWSANIANVDPELLSSVLEGAGRLASDVLAPLNAPGDRAGVKFDDGAVRTAPGFREAYAAFAAGGWQGLSADPAYGGQGLPQAVALAVYEMMHGANMSFALCPMLTLGAIDALLTHASEDLRALYLPKLVSGEWTGTMNLTEPQAGSDLGALSTKAVPSADGTFRLNGQKIFITWGEHDLTPNIVHLVLARLPDAPPGSKGISLFLSPKILPDGARNRIRCIGVEEKMGIHASPTCAIAYEDAAAWLIGAPNKGLAAMFTMMNAARLNVGVQGVAIAEAAYQKAVSYARERRQGGSFIVEHPDVARMLAAMKAKTQAARAICYATAVARDRGDRAREDLLTPIAKAWCTDWGVQAASIGVQVHGGMGYVEEGGAAQFYRDARIAPIYEGTNGIQAIDLVGRKLALDDGQAMRALIVEAKAIAAAARDSERSAPGAVAQRLAVATEALATATNYILSRMERRDALAGATEYLNLAGDVLGGMLLLNGVLRSPDPAQETLLVFYVETVLARTPSALPAICLGSGILDEIASISWLRR